MDPPYTSMVRSLSILGLLLAAACDGRSPRHAADPSEVPGSAEAEAETAESETAEAATTGSAARCALEATPAPAPALPDALAEVAPQYFHASHRGGFDAYRGGPPVFPWFDVHRLETPVVPPRGVRVAASSARTLYVVRDGTLGVWPRDGEVRWTEHALHPEEAVEADGGRRWVLARSRERWHVAAIAPDGEVTVRDLARPASSWDVRIAATADDRLAVAWLERDGGTLRVRVRFGDEPPRTVDEVTMPAPVAALSERSRVDLALAAHGERGLGVAWRPLDDPDLGDVGSASVPPTTPADAQVRWLVVEPDGVVDGPRSVRTVARTLGGVTGVGPWALRGNGMKAATLAGRAVFAWVDDEAIRGVLADADAPVDLAPRRGAPLLAFRPRAGALELLLLDSTPRVRVRRLACE